MTTTTTTSESTPTLDEFIEECRAFLDAHLPKRAADGAFVWGEGSDSVAFFEQTTPEAELAQVREGCEFRRRRYDAGLGWITGPVEFGGRALPSEYEVAFYELESQYATPNMNCFTIGLGMVAPTILAHAQEHIRQRYLPRLYRGDLLACQLFSEPGAGSDLASLQTRAERDGDEWVITGQKVWTSLAHYCDIGEVIARTDPSLPKHSGLTAFVIDMHAPGVDVRPLRQMTGGANFNEVFLSEVRVPDDHRLGDVNGGWRVALTTLMNERATIGSTGGGGGADKLLPRVIELARHLGSADDPIVRQGLADLVIRFRVAELTNRRLQHAGRGRPAGPERSMGKLASALNSSVLVDFVGTVLGPRLVADSGEWGTYAWHEAVLGDAASHIAGGSDQVMRNILGERVLGLPKDPGIDTTKPFRETLVDTRSAHQSKGTDR